MIFVFSFSSTVRYKHETCPNKDCVFRLCQSTHPSNIIISRLREPNKKDLILPEEMKNSSIHIKHVHSTYQKYKKLQSQRQKAHMHRSIHNNKVSTRWGDQPEILSSYSTQKNRRDTLVGVCMNKGIDYMIIVKTLDAVYFKLAWKLNLRIGGSK